MYVTFVTVGLSRLVYHILSHIYCLNPCLSTSLTSHLCPLLSIKTHSPILSHYNQIIFILHLFQGLIFVADGRFHLEAAMIRNPLIKGDPLVCHLLLYPLPSLYIPYPPFPRPPTPPLTILLIESLYTYI